MFLASLNSVSVIHFACAFCCNLLFYLILFSFEYGPEEGFSAQALIRCGYPSHFNLLYRPSPTIAAVGADKENWFSGPVLEGGGKLLREVSAPRPDLGGQPVHFFQKSCGANSASRARDFDRVLMFAVLPRVYVEFSKCRESFSAVVRGYGGKTTCRSNHIDRQALLLVPLLHASGRGSRCFVSTAPCRRRGPRGFPKCAWSARSVTKPADVNVLNVTRGSGVGRGRWTYGRRAVVRARALLFRPSTAAVRLKAS